ncbi:MAG TPA: hypothetical protein VEL76_31160, partial [Gemmataceae bacterium]|nr:hypothetical protein [Gemmataceae bacterium]
MSPPVKRRAARREPAGQKASGVSPPVKLALKPSPAGSRRAARQQITDSKRGGGELGRQAGRAGG